MNKQMLYAVLALAVLAAAGPTVASHLLNGHTVGAHAEVRGQVRFTDPAAQQPPSQAFAAWHEAWPTHTGMSR